MRRESILHIKRHYVAEKKCEEVIEEALWDVRREKVEAKVKLPKLRMFKEKESLSKAGAIVTDMQHEIS